LQWKLHIADNDITIYSGLVLWATLRNTSKGTCLGILIVLLQKLGNKKLQTHLQAFKFAMITFLQERSVYGFSFQLSRNSAFQKKQLFVG
jgi:hypothetical protein